MRSMSLSISSSSFAVCGQLVEFLAASFVEEVARFEHAAQGFAQIVHVVIELLKARIGIVEAGVEQVVGQRLQQVFEIDLGGQVAAIFGVANALHRAVLS